MVSRSNVANVGAPCVGICSKCLYASERSTWLKFNFLLTAMVASVYACSGASKRLTYYISFFTTRTAAGMPTICPYSSQLSGLVVDELVPYVSSDTRLSAGRVYGGTAQLNLLI